MVCSRKGWLFVGPQVQVQSGLANWASGSRWGQRVEGAVPRTVSLNFSLVVVVVEVGLENCADSLLDEEAGLDGFRIPCRLKFLDSLCGHEDVGLGTQLC